MLVPAYSVNMLSQQHILPQQHTLMPTYTATYVQCHPLQYRKTPTRYALTMPAIACATKETASSSVNTSHTPSHATIKNGQSDPNLHEGGERKRPK